MRHSVLRTSLGLVALLGAVACDGSTRPQSTTYVSVMTGAKERPDPNNSTATGTATYVLTGNILSFTVTVNGLSGPTTGAHIHVGEEHEPGPIIYPFTHAAVQTGTVASGSINLSQPIVSGSTSITGDSLRVLLNNGNAYTNVHTAMFPGGEVRGQIVRQ